MPLGAAEIYRQRGWDKFNNIVEDIDVNADVSSIEYEDTPSDICTYFNMAGVKTDIHDIMIGDVYIENSSHGTRKVIFRHKPTSK